jgi:hypothetical protein
MIKNDYFMNQLFKHYLQGIIYSGKNSTMGNSSHAKLMTNKSQDPKTGKPGFIAKGFRNRMYFD